MRRAKVDTNQKQIVDGLRACGYSVLHIHTLKNCCDIICGAHGMNFMFEIKNSPKDKLTEGEQKFQDSWRGNVETIYCLEDAIRIIKCSLF